MAELSLPRSTPQAPQAPSPAERARPEAPVDDGRAALWRVAWAPYWLWSDVPPPVPPQREPALAGELGPAGEVVRRGIDEVRRRLWLRHAFPPIVRGLWLGLAIGCLWVLANLIGAPEPSWVVLAWVTGVLVALGVVYAAVGKPGRWAVARMLDRSFALQERMTTAVADLGRGVPADGERASVVYLQMADAANVIEEIRRHKALGPRLPVREIVMALIAGLLLAALVFLRGVGGAIPPLATSEVPVFTPAVERPEAPAPVANEFADQQLAPSIEEVLARSERSGAARRDLLKLAEALADHAVTRPPADAIAEGDYDAGADELRSIAPDADQLSPAAREELARDLASAAGEMSAGSEALRAAAEQAASGLRQGEAAAEQGVDTLGDAVEQTGEEVVSQRELAEQMQQAQEARARGEPTRGMPSSAGDPNAAGAPAGEAGPSGEPGQMGQGADAQPGGGQPGQGGQPGRGAQGTEGSAGQPGGEGDPGGREGGAPGEGMQPGEGPAGGEPGGEASQGGGAGSGDGESAQSAEAIGGDGGDQEAGEGEPAEQRISEGDGAEAEPGEAGDVSETLSLPPGSGDQGIQTSADGGSAMRGSGAGVTAGSGEAVQGEVGVAGPDSNRVPADYRKVVENYFSDGGT